MNSFSTTAVEETIREAIIGKLNSYNPEPAVMPFQVRLLGRDRLALYSFIHSLSTTFGTSIYEPVAKAIAINRFDYVVTQAEAPKEMSIHTRQVIDDIIRRLEASTIEANRDEHHTEIRAASNESAERTRVRLTKIDVLLRQGNSLFLIDIKTAKPNVSGFQKYKRTLLDWMGAFLDKDKSLSIYPIIAIPYNPYEPEPYQRWTMRGMLDIQNELKVAEEFWDFLGGVGTYDKLLDCFERVGIGLRDEIDGYFAQFSTQHV